MTKGLSEGPLNPGSPLLSWLAPLSCTCSGVQREPPGVVAWGEPLLWTKEGQGPTDMGPVP